MLNKDKDFKNITFKKLYSSSKILFEDESLSETFQSHQLIFAEIFYEPVSVKHRKTSIDVRSYRDRVGITVGKVYDENMGCSSYLFISTDFTLRSADGVKKKLS